MSEHGGAREGAGGPPKPDELKAKGRSLKATDADWAKLGKLAKKEGMNKTEWIISKIRTAKL